MTVPGSANPLLLRSAAPAAYQIERSLRFNSSDSAYLSRTPASTSNRRTFTWAGWVKRSALSISGSPSGRRCLFSAYNNSTGDYFFLYFSHSPVDALSVELYGTTTAVYRDTGAWMHVVLAVDTTAAAATDRMKLYINGALQPISTPSLSLNQDLPVNFNGSTHNIGSGYYGAPGLYFNGYMADIHFIDGQALTPSSFTEVDANTGQLIPKQYTGSFGTNGFWLKFSDNSAVTATTLGKDYSGNSNNWTPNNLSVTAGAGNDSLVDTPTSYGEDTGAGGEVRGNYATGNPLFSVNPSFRTLANGNLDWSYTNGSNTAVIPATVFPASGKWYAEFAFTSFATGGRIGIVNTNCTDVYVGQTTNGVGYENTGQIRYNGGVTSYGASWIANDLIGVALDLDNGTVSFYKNGASQGVARSGLTGSWTFGVDAFSGTCIANFGQRPFAYTAPSGFKALCTTNLPDPVVAKPSTVMDVALWTGNGGNQSITLPGGFNPDLVWVKSRSNAQDHYLFDAVRGGASILRSNTTGAESTGTTYLSFDTSGFSSLNGLSSNGYTYAGWCWDAGTSTVTNTQGSITSQVRANASAGFSIVTYTGNGSSTATFGHGLGVTPGFFIIKNRSSSCNWMGYHSATGKDAYYDFNTTNPVQLTIPNIWGTSGPSSSLITVTGAYLLNNQNGQNYVCYAFAPVAGYSSFGSYTGNGNNDGPFVYTGFRPRWVMIKRTDTADHWVLQDTARDPYNIASQYLLANLSNAEGTSAIMDITSNGFKQRNTFASNNASGGTYVWAAFAESPFQYARAR